QRSLGPFGRVETSVPPSNGPSMSATPNSPSASPAIQLGTPFPNGIQTRSLPRIIKHYATDRGSKLFPGIRPNSGQALQHVANLRLNEVRPCFRVLRYLVGDFRVGAPRKRPRRLLQLLDDVAGRQGSPQEPDVVIPPAVLIAGIRQIGATGSVDRRPSAK